MNADPSVARANDSRESILAVMRRKGLHHMPLLDEKGIVVGLDTLDDLIQTRTKDNWVVLMAGGLGSRLRPLTTDCPKPMLKVGNKPLLETILQNFIEYGFHRFYVSVNYMAEVVKAYFGDGSRWGVEIRYLQEDQRLGTAGALSLLSERPKEPMLVMNGDLLTKVNFSQLLDFHISHDAIGTMCVREYDFQIPYGVVKIDKHRITGIEEKPIQRFFVNAGIYVLEPDVLDCITVGEYFDMPTLFEKIIEQKKETVVFPIREYWLDIGHMADYERANGEYTEIFA
jgi:NDP-sugar pyrophosphorylase family protein